MSGRAVVQSFVSWWPWHLKPRTQSVAGAVLSPPEQRQRALQRLRMQGLPVVNEEPQSCDGCGRELLLGERALLVERDDELALACPLCAERLLREGYRRVSLESTGNARHLPAS